MSASLISALLFTMVLVITTVYSLMGSVPLLTLAHDTPMDSRVVRAFFNGYYLVEMVTAGAVAVSLAFSGRPAFAAGAAGLVLLATALRKGVIAKMDSLRVQMQSNAGTAIRAFRRLHVAAILVNAAQLVVIVGGLITVSIQVSDLPHRTASASDRSARS